LNISTTPQRRGGAVGFNALWVYINHEGLGDILHKGIDTHSRENIQQLHQGGQFVAVSVHRMK
jgi:hypothetical protein